RFDLSWITTIAFGARQLHKSAVAAWSEPLLDAFVAGAWLLHWTADTLYWVAKPAVHVETIDGRRRLHNEVAAALESDVENLYFWHGVLVPEIVVMRPERITLQHIASEHNAEVRRVMIERYGEDRYIVDSGMKAVAHHDRWGTLYHQPFDRGRPICKLRVVNRSPEPDGSFKPYWLSVNPIHYNGDAGKIPQAAVASTWRTKPGGTELFFRYWRDYNPAIET
ncbi:MAG: hypothetical protein NUV75_14255, partial [Gallionella sp.]|nr:hypothetical protein [Gallionella sp.]